MGDISFSKTILDEIEDFGLDESFATVGPSFTAIDFETATHDGNSICEVGIAKVEKGKVVSSSIYCIQPPGNKYDQRNIGIHGITPEDTEGCDDFATEWRRICYEIECGVVVAHNTSFDMTVLRKRHGKVVVVFLAADGDRLFHSGQYAFAIVVLVAPNRCGTFNELPNGNNLKPLQATEFVRHQFHAVLHFAYLLCHIRIFFRKQRDLYVLFHILSN